MRAFALVWVVAAVIGGFVGGELSDKTFSILGAVVGGVGTAAVMLGLGAHFSAQEERRKKEALPPEMRQVFDRMFGNPEKARALVASAHDWHPRPFHENQSKADQADWFANAPRWNEVDSRLILLLIDRLHGNLMFEVFVHASQDCGVIPKYEPLNILFDRGVGDVAALPRVAEILCTTGAAQAARFTKILQSGKGDRKELIRLNRNVMNACEASIHLEPNYLQSYVHLALHLSMLNQKDDAVKFCKQGLETVNRLRNYPFHLSELATIKNAHQGLDQVEGVLKSILTSIE